MIITEHDLIGDIHDFPIHIVRAMCIEQVRQGNKHDVTVFQKSKSADKRRGGFDWGQSFLGEPTWSNIVAYRKFDKIPPPQHPHAESIMLFAHQSLESQTPWVFWEFSHDNGKTWIPCGKCPSWGENILYRQRSPKIQVGDVMVNRPIDTPPEIGTTIFVTDITSPFMYYRTQWTGTYSNSNTEMLKRGLVHLTQESAIEHSKALISLSGGTISSFIQNT